jgi:hypothetical protein
LLNLNEQMNICADGASLAMNGRLMLAAQAELAMRLRQQKKRARSDEHALVELR